MEDLIQNPPCFSMCSMLRLCGGDYLETYPFTGSRKKTRSTGVARSGSMSSAPSWYRRRLSSSNCGPSDVEPDGFAVGGILTCLRPAESLSAGCPPGGIAIVAYAHALEDTRESQTLNRAPGARMRDDVGRDCPRQCRRDTASRGDTRSRTARRSGTRRRGSGIVHGRRRQQGRVADPCRAEEHLGGLVRALGLDKNWVPDRCAGPCRTDGGVPATAAPQLWWSKFSAAGSLSG